MLKKVLLILGLSIAATAGTQAHPGGHGRAIPEEEAAVIASQQISRLVEAGKLPPSWELASLKVVTLKETTSGDEYVVSFSNIRISNPEKATLYIFLTESGEYVAANFSGH